MDFGHGVGEIERDAVVVQALPNIAGKAGRVGLRFQERYDKLAEKLKDLQEQKRRREADAIMDAYLKSGKSLEEIMTFLKP